MNFAEKFHYWLLGFIGGISVSMLLAAIIL